MFVDFLHLPANHVIAKIVLRDLNQKFQDQTFKMAILASKRWKWKRYYFYHRGKQVFANEWQSCECRTS